MSVVASPALAPDERLPQRDLLLDPVALAERLGQTLGADGPVHISAIERLGAKYRPGESLRLALRVWAGSANVIVGCRTYPPDGGRPGTTVGPASDPGPFRDEVYDRSLNTLFWTFPRDRRIRRLDVLFPFASNPIGDGWSGSRLLRYVPEKRATAAMVDRWGTTCGYAKVYAGQDVEQAALALRTLRAHLEPGDGAPRLPHVLACLPEHGFMAIEALPGRPLADDDPQQILGAMEALGRAVAMVHGVLVRIESAPDDDDTALDLRTLEMLDDHVAQRAAALRMDLLSSQPKPEGDVCLHGDLHFGNVLMADRAVGLIDTDLANTGPAARDLAEVIARLRLRRRLGTMSAAESSDAEMRFLAGYATQRPVPGQPALAWHVAHKLLSRVYAAVRQMRPELLHRVEGILDEAEEAAA
jgi:aminoglycoside phosphotransferase (APT) family kinase protein